MRIRIDGIPPSLNRTAGRANVWQYRDEKALWTKKVYFAAKRLAPAEPMKKAVVRITYHFPDRRRRDPDNFCGKYLLDGLTKAGVIADDSFGVITLQLAGVFGGKEAWTEIEVIADDL